jgi:hypothetical protein
MGTIIIIIIIIRECPKKFTTRVIRYEEFVEVSNCVVVFTVMWFEAHTSIVYCQFPVLISCLSFMGAVILLSDSPM